MKYHASPNLDGKTRLCFGITNRTGYVRYLSLVQMRYQRVCLFFRSLNRNFNNSNIKGIKDFYKFNTTHNGSEDKF